ncbi:MAG: hypothetical protein IT450_09135 [Phycisphaerales bacterium]|nr:hypothetical protein [Phycisphaerales bacterium]
MVTALTTMSLLFGAMTSAVVIASRALPNPSDPAEKTATAAEALDQITADLSTAITIKQATPTVLEFTVPDRGHGPAGPETICYSWSGTPGAAVTRQYNGGTARTLAADVQQLSFELRYGARELTQAPRVLMLVDNRQSLWDPWETTQKTKIQAWGSPVTTLRCDATAAEFAAAIIAADVIFVTLYADLPSQAPALLTAPRGVVVECSALSTLVGVASTSTVANGNSISSIDTSHAITGMLPSPPGSVVLASQQTQLLGHSGLAPGARSLAASPANLCVLELGGILQNGGSAPARRVLLPWGGTSFDNQYLSQEGWNLLRRSLVWASARRVVVGITITIQTGTTPAVRSVSDVPLLNQPEAP